MSLQAAAQHLAAHGRGPDDQLVHMSSKELAGLQALAQAHGGTLTKNPHTGLPEAGFLDSLMPTIVGAGLTLMGMPAWGAGLTVGGLETARTGNLGKGLMAGLSGWGGGEMLGGVMDTGAGAIGSAAAQEGADQEAVKQAMADASKWQKLKAGVGMIGNPGTMQALGGWKPIAAVAAPLLMQQPKVQLPATTPATIHPYTFAANPQQVANQITPAYQPNQDTSERTWLSPAYTALPTYTATYATGGITSLAGGGDAQPYIQGVSAPGVVEQMSQANSVGQNTGYPLAQIHRGAYATPWQTPVSENMLEHETDTNVDPNTGEMRLAGGGLSDLGGYSDGGRLLRGPGDGVSDSIPAQIGGKQPARLADGEFVVPARIVSELGNGSTDAGARQLYKMMDRVQQARAKTTAKGKMAKNTNASKYLPA